MYNSVNVVNAIELYTLNESNGKCHYIYLITMKKTNEILIHVRTRLNIKNIVKEKSQAEKDT